MTLCWRMFHGSQCGSEMKSLSVYCPTSFALFTPVIFSYFCPWLIDMGFLMANANIRSSGAQLMGHNPNMGLWGIAGLFRIKSIPNAQNKTLDIYSYIRIFIY